jgi:hypothetical protein
MGGEPSRYTRYDGWTRTRERAAKLVAAFEDERERPFTAGQLSLVSGFPAQACAVALAALKAGRFVVKFYDPAWKHQTWRRSQPSDLKPVSEQGDLDEWVSVRDAAALTGASEKLIRSRMDRRTLGAYTERRRRYTTRRALTAAGLLSGGKPRAQIHYGLFRLVEWLSLRPGDYFATSYLQLQAGLRRQQCEIALATLEAAQLTCRAEDVSYQNAVWTWTGPIPPRAKPPGTARPRPSPRPWRRPHVTQEGGMERPGLG